MYRGKTKGFGQRFFPPGPSPYLECLLPHAGEFERSKVSLSLIRNDIKAFRPAGSDFSHDPYMRCAIKKAFRSFALPTPVKMLHLNDVFGRDLPIWSSSPGLPWVNQGYRTKGDIRKDPDAIQRVRWFWHRVKMGKEVFHSDCCAFVRAQIVRAGETKARCVWGYPATIVFGEAVFALPLIEAYMRHNTPIAYGYETGNAGMRKIVDCFKGSYFLGVDFKAFDKSAPTWLIRVAFDILMTQIDMVHYQDYGVARVDSMIRMWDYIVNYFVNTPIRMCNGERYEKRGGIASGSYFTQLIGSIVNYILLTYSLLRLRAEVYSIKVFGDDSLCGLSRRVAVEDVAELLK
ncbi:RNA-directed RNA polymerase [Anthophora plagiata]